MSTRHRQYYSTKKRYFCRFCEEGPVRSRDDDPIPVRIELHVPDEMGFPITTTTINHSLLLSEEKAEAAKAKLSPLLSSVGIPANFHTRLIDDISSCSWTMSSIEECPTCHFPLVPGAVVSKVIEIQANGVVDHEIGGAMEELALVDAFVMVPATLSSIEALEKVVIPDKQCCCAICFEELVGGSEATRMPCSHVYHSDCIVPWLKTSHFCPLCRYEMPRLFKFSSCLRS